MSNAENVRRPRRVVASTPEDRARVEEALTEMRLSADPVRRRKWADVRAEKAAQNPNFEEGVAEARAHLADYVAWLEAELSWAYRQIMGDTEDTQEVAGWRAFNGSKKLAAVIDGDA